MLIKIIYFDICIWCSVLAISFLAGCNTLNTTDGFNKNASGNTNRALLIGIGDYSVAPLQGPPNDLEALEAILPKWGFLPQNITVVKNQQADKDGILQAMRSLADTAQSGDKVLIYFSGHGTSAKDQDFGHQLPLPHTSGALIPANFTQDSADTIDKLTQKLIIGRNDIRPIFEILDSKGIHVLAMFDACYSGNTVRSVFASPNTDLRPRRIDLKPMTGSPIPIPVPRRTLKREPYPYRNVIYLGASSETEPAADIEGASAQFTIDGKPHGAFTNALLQILGKQVPADANKDGYLSPAELYASIVPLVNKNYSQTPQMLPSIHQDANNNQNRGFFINTTASGNSQSSTTLESNQKSILSIWLDKYIFGNTEHNKSRSSRALVRVSPVSGTAVAKTVHTADLNVVRMGTDVQLVLANGHPLARYRNADKINMEAVLAQQAAAWPLRRLHNTDAGFQIQLERGGSGSDGVAVEGSLVGFAVRAPRPVYYLALDVDPEGRVSVLYPNSQLELRPIPANQVVDLGGQIRVTAPFGTDYVKVFAFTQSPPNFKQWIGQTNIAPTDPKFRELSCLVGIDKSNSADTCSAVGIADATFTLATYPASEVPGY